MKRIFHPVTGLPFTLGRRLPKTWAPQFDVSRYVDPNGPKRPLGARWESKAIRALHNPLGNDQYGDCVFAGGEIYAVFSPDWLNAATQTSPSGLNAAQLAADLAAA